MQEVPYVKPPIMVYVCCNDRTIVPGNTKSCCALGLRKDQIKEVKHWIKDNGLLGYVNLTATHCQGYCNPDGAVATFYPGGKSIKGIQGPEDLKKLILEEIEKLKE